MQYVVEAQLAALITAMHRCAQRRVPVMLVGAGLPQLRGRMGNARSYAERLFDFPEVGPLAPPAARIAIAKPVEGLGAQIDEPAVDKIVEETKGYPYFLQEVGQARLGRRGCVADRTRRCRARHGDHHRSAGRKLFRVRFDRLTPAEKEYLRAMAELGPGPHRSGDIADCLMRKVTALGPTRNQLIAKGMIWSPSHGDTAFTVPLFDEFMRRIMPGDDWR